MTVDRTALTVFVTLFALVTLLGLAASRWRSANLDELHEWGLGGRRFGTLVTWFLLGGDLYSAYTFVAVPALVFGAGALGFFAMPFSVIAYPLVFLFMPRLWSVAHKHGYITAADFVRGRFDSRALALVVALTGLLATMPYIALQLVGIQVVLAAMGIEGDWPLILAFVVLAAYTYRSGLRAPALIAIVKDAIIYITVLAAVIVIPVKLGGFGRIFDAVPPQKLLVAPGQITAYSTMALGSAMALFLYPHSVTGALASNDRTVIQRNAALLPAYSFLLGLVALLGYMALAAKVGSAPAYAAGFRHYGPNFAVPALFLASFPSWFAGFAFAALAIGALVPASIMSIAAANLFTRNIYKELVRPTCGGREEARVAKTASLAVKLGALAFILLLPQKYAIELQLLGGVWILQTLPTIALGLYTRRLHRWALVGGWAVGMGVGTSMAAARGFQSTLFSLHVAGCSVLGYAAVWALIANLGISASLTFLFDAFGLPRGTDATAPEDYGEPQRQPSRGARP